MQRNLSKYKAIVLGNSHSDPNFVREIGRRQGFATVNDSISKFNTHVVKMCRKVS